MGHIIWCRHGHYYPSRNAPSVHWQPRQEARQGKEGIWDGCSFYSSWVCGIHLGYGSQRKHEFHHCSKCAHLWQYLILAMNLIIIIISHSVCVCVCDCTALPVLLSQEIDNLFLENLSFVTSVPFSMLIFWRKERKFFVHTEGFFLKPEFKLLNYGNSCAVLFLI